MRTEQEIREKIDRIRVQASHSDAFTQEFFEAIIDCLEWVLNEENPSI